MADIMEDQQREFWRAVKQNDVIKMDDILQSMQRQEIVLDINAADEDHQTPLIVAISSNYIEVTSLLLKHGAKIGDALLYAIELDSNTLVRLICEHLKTSSQETLSSAVNGLSTGGNFKPVSNSLMYAARQNSHDIVKTLVQYGAEIPTLKTVFEYSKEGEDSYEQYLACLFWHQAISSEAYLLYASTNPLQAAIDAGKAVQKAKSSQQHHLQSGYDQLMEQLDQFVTKFVEIASTENEISALLRKVELEIPGGNDKIGVLPQRVRDSLDLNYKQFISSTACTHFVLDQWYMKWKEMSMLSFILWTTLVVAFQPLLCLAYIILPFKFHRKIMKTPYVRFLLHWMSRIYFIGFLIYSTSYGSMHLEDDRNEKMNQIFIYFTSPPSVVYILTYIWVLGMTWREIREFWSGGFKSYWKDFFNYSDIAQLLLYWTSMFFRILSFLHRKAELKQACTWVMFLNLTVNFGSSFSQDDSVTEMISKYTMCDQFSAIPGMVGSAMSEFSHDDNEYNGLNKRDVGNASSDSVLDSYNSHSSHNDYVVNTRFDSSVDDDSRSTEDDTFPFGANDPSLTAEGLFGIATVLSFLALLRDVVVVAFVGPLRVSLGGMLNDIIRFLILFIFVWISFALGLTQLYQTYDIINQAYCHGSEEGCHPSAFISLSESLASLFWSLFNPIDEESLHIDPQYQFTLIAGEALYAIYMVVIVVVMLNALIAMMSNTYTRVEENSEIEWKVARTNLMAEYMTTTATLPPPYNLFPTLRILRNWLTAPCRKIHSSRQKYRQPIEKEGETVELQQKKTLVRTLVDRYIISRGNSEETNDRSDLRKLSAEIVELKVSLQKIDGNMEVLLQLVQNNQPIQQSKSGGKKSIFK